MRVYWLLDIGPTFIRQAYLDLTGLDILYGTYVYKLERLGHELEDVDRPPNKQIWTDEGPSANPTSKP